MYDQVKALKEGKTVEKRIYNHVTGVMDPPETIESPDILILEGLHPFADERVREMFDFKIYLDISDDVKFAWKIQRDMVERGHSLESIQQSIEARKPDFDAFVAPQRGDADVVIQVLPTDLIPDEKEGKVLKVKFIQKEGKDNFDPAYLFDEGSTIEWTPCGKKLTCSYPGIKFAYGPDEFLGNDVTVLEMDGKFDNLQELVRFCVLCFFMVLSHWFPHTDLRRVPPLEHGDQVLRRAHAADDQDGRQPRLGQRHRILPDACVPQDPRVLREALGRRGRG